MIEYIIGIAGGSGSGKSTLAYSLYEKFSDQIEVLNFDDYHKKKEIVPKLYGMTNWDHPDAIDFDKLLKDITKLKLGKDVELMTKNEYYNPDYPESGRIIRKIKPKKILIVEGYLSLFNESIRKLFNYSIFLDLDFKERTKRRTKFINQEYLEKILLPMHQKYLEPTKKYANFILEIEQLSKEEVLDKVVLKIKNLNIITS